MELEDGYSGTRGWCLLAAHFLTFDHETAKPHSRFASPLASRVRLHSAGEGRGKKD